MRRADKEIRGKREIEKVITSCKVCRIGFTDGKEPYVLPFNFGYSKGNVYLHCARQGKKLEILKKNPRVCFEADTMHELVTAGDACGHGFKYKSVVGTGRAAVIKSGPEHLKGLKAIMSHQTGRGHRVFRESGMQSVYVIRIRLGRMTGKSSGY